MGEVISSKRRSFRRLHEQGCFVLPNPWDIGSALFLERQGFKALATTSAGVAWSQGKPDGGLDRDQVLAHMEVMASTCNVPINADFEAGFAKDAEGVYQNVKLAIETGVAGLSIEDSTANPDHPLYTVEQAVERLAAARQAIDEQGGEVVLVGRAENFFIGEPDIEDVISRLQAYGKAGADCLYAPGIRTAQEIYAVVGAVHPKPVNLLVNHASEFSLPDIQKMGIRRISLGSSMAASAWASLSRISQAIVKEGSFAGLAHAFPGRELNQLFRR